MFDVYIYLNEFKIPQYISTFWLVNEKLLNNIHRVVTYLIFYDSTFIFHIPEKICGKGLTRIIVHVVNFMLLSNIVSALLLTVLSSPP